MVGGTAEPALAAAAACAVADAVVATAATPIGGEATF